MCRDENIQESEFATASSSTYNQELAAKDGYIIP